MLGIKIDKKDEKILFNYFCKNAWIYDNKMNISKGEIIKNIYSIKKLILIILSKHFYAVYHQEQFI